MGERCNGVAITDPIVAPGSIDDEMLTEGLGHGLSSLSKNAYELPPEDGRLLATNRLPPTTGSAAYHGKHLIAITV